jgi:acyl-CoA synthetase (AMP-forming)/AMP-acid ligase II
LVQHYGLAEVTGNITVLPPHEHGRALPQGLEFGTCGYARTGMQISIQDDELPVGSQGEICVAGPAVSPGTSTTRCQRRCLLDEHGYLYCKHVLPQLGKRGTASS